MQESVHERVCTCPCEAWTDARRPRLPADSRIDGDHVLLLRLSEMVRLRGAAPDSLHQQRPAHLLAVLRVRYPWSELVYRSCGVDLLRPTFLWILEQEAGHARRRRIAHHV